MKHFQPNPQCGNCQSFRRSKKDRNKVVLETAFCAKNQDPENCDEFGSRQKRHKTKQRHVKSWKLERRNK